MVAALAAVSCARATSEGSNQLAKKYFNAWAKVNIPEARHTELGSYVIEEQDGQGKAITEDFISAEFIIRTLDGKIASSTYEDVAKQLGSYARSDYYGPKIWFRGENSLYAGIEELIAGKHVGYHVKAAIPGCILTSDRYDTADEYVENVSGTDYIYEFTIMDAFDDVVKYEVDSLVRYLKRNYPKVNPADTVEHEINKYGLYYIQLKEPVIKEEADTAYTDGDKVNFNYTGMLLNGTIFDTTVEKTAKDAGIYSSSNTYGATYMTWNEDYTQMTMGESATSTIDGFAYAVNKMLPGEKGIVLFISSYGYGYDGSGNSIPPYAPLAFLLEVEESE